MSFTSHYLLAAVANEHIADLRREADAARLVRAATAHQPGRTWPASVVSAPDRLLSRLRLTVTRPSLGPAQCCA